MASFPCDYPSRGWVDVFPSKVLPEHLKAHHGCIVRITPITRQPGAWNRADNLLIARMRNGEPLIGRSAFRYGAEMVESGTGDVWLSFSSEADAYSHIQRIIKKTNLSIV